MTKKFLTIIALIIVSAIALSAGEIPSIKVIHLEKNQLTSLGVVVNKGKVEYIELAKPDKGKKTTSGQVVMISPDKIDVKKSSKIDVRQLPKVTPVLAVTIDGQNGSAYYAWEETARTQTKSNMDELSSNSERLNKLVAVKIRPEIIGNDIYLWYEPTEEFLSLLPDRFRQDIKKELIQMPQSENDAYTNMASNTDIINNLIIFPNPSLGTTAEISFKLMQPRSFNITLYDIYGNALRTVQEGVYIKSGSYRTQLNFEGFPEGLYLAAIVTDKGEKIIQRLVVLY